MDVAFAATVTEAGAVSVGAALLESATTAPLVGAAFDNVTVQVDTAFAPRLLGAHTTEDTRAGATKDTVVDVEDPFSEAVSVAV